MHPTTLLPWTEAEGEYTHANSPTLGVCGNAVIIHCSYHNTPSMEEGTVMTTAQVGYAPVHRWVKPVLGSMHTTVVVTVAWAVLCLLVAQRVTPAALARALRARRFRPIVPAAGAALVARSGP